MQTFVCVFQIGFQTKTLETHALKLLNNLHGMKQGGCNFHENLKSELIGEKRDFVQLDADLYTFYEEGIIVLWCVDYCLMFAQDDNKIDILLIFSSEDFLCVDEGEADRYLGE